MDLIHVSSIFVHLFIHVSSLQFLRLQLCVSRGDELVSENLRLRTESSELEEAEDETGTAVEMGWREVDSFDHFKWIFIWVCLKIGDTHK